MREYNPKTCVTAGELRAMGIPIPERVPDVGWIPRTAMRWTGAAPGATTEEEKAQGILNLSLEVRFTEPFQWIDVEFDVKETE